MNEYSLDSSLIECIKEALAITMLSNNGTFNSTFFTQVNGATIAGPESASTTDKYSFVTTWDPGFQDIRNALHKFTNILMEDEECREVFPKGSFRVAFKKGHKNLEEIIAPSRSMFSIREGPCGKNTLGKEGSCKKCGK